MRLRLPIVIASNLFGDEREVDFRASELLGSDLGQPPSGSPEALQRKVLKCGMSITVQPSSLLLPTSAPSSGRRRDQPQN